MSAAVNNAPASWRAMLLESLEALQHIADHVRLQSPDASEQFDCARSITIRGLNHLDVEQGLARYRDFAPEMNLTQIDQGEAAPSAYALRIAAMELQGIEITARTNASALPSKIGEVCYGLARLVSGGKLRDADTRTAIKTTAENCGVFTLIDRDTFNAIAQRNWRNGLARPRTLKTEKRAAQ